MENEKINLLSEKIRHIAENVVNKGYAHREKGLTFSEEGWKAFGEFKLHGAAVSVDKGGAGFSYQELHTLMHDLGYYSIDNGLNFSIAAHALACVLPLNKYCNSATEALLPDFCTGKKILTNAITEKQGGSDVFKMKTTAVKSDKGYVLDGVKSFCSNAPVADFALIYASTDDTKGFLGGITAFLVPLDSKGVVKGNAFEKMGLRTCSVCEIEFDKVQVSNDHIIGKIGSGGIIFQESMIWEKIFIASIQTGTMKRWMEEMAQYVKARDLSKHQALTHQLAKAKVEMEACNALVNQVVRSLATTGLSAQIPQAAIVKYLVSNTMTQLASVYLNIFGGEGYKTDKGVEVQVRDAMAATIYSGTSEIQLNMIASAIIK